MVAITATTMAKEEAETVFPAALLLLVAATVIEFFLVPAPLGRETR